MAPLYRLVDFPYVLVRLRCETCRRSGAYRLARVAVKYGAEITLDDLLIRLSSDCPWRNEPRGSCGHALPICRRARPPDMPAQRMAVIRGGKA